MAEQTSETKGLDLQKKMAARRKLQAEARNLGVKNVHPLMLQRRIDKAKAAKSAAAVKEKERLQGVKRGMRTVNPSSMQRQPQSAGGKLRTVARDIIKNPARAALRRKARMGQTTQFVSPTLGAS